MPSRLSSFFVSLIALIAVSALMSSSPTRAADEPSVYRHVVFLKFKDTATVDQVKQIEDEFRKLPSMIRVIAGFEWGTNMSPETLNDGFTHCFLVSFKEKAGIDAYLPHPAHQEVVKRLKPHLDKVCGRTGLWKNGSGGNGAYLRPCFDQSLVALATSNASANPR